MQILRTRGTTYKSWGGYLSCRVYPYYLPILIFKYAPRTSSRFLTFVPGYAAAYIYSDLPIGMSADTCIQYWDGL